MARRLTPRPRARVTADVPHIRGGPWQAYSSDVVASVATTGPKRGGLLRISQRNNILLRAPALAYPQNSRPYGLVYDTLAGK